VDDLDGTTADENVSFGLEGVEYEIDLSTEHAEALREVLAPYAAAARRTGGRQTSRPAAPRPASPSGGTTAARSRSTNGEIRSWAAEHGVVLAERGRIPGRVVEAFEAGDPARLPHSGNGNGTAPPAPAEPAAPAAPTAAEPTATGPADGEAPRGRDGLTAAEREAIRAWAVGEGIEVKPRGQLKKDLISNYRAWEARQR
jgi:pyruvate/2-oxoglutarate dehydrogenase complex dihydrolipoamide acyltransferase (E2) component